jgi:DNA-directed RNA polymerase specialized sigma24 family protein
MASSSRLITYWIHNLRDGQHRERAQRILVEYFREPLVRALRKRGPLWGKYDTEDAALDALRVALGALEQEDSRFDSRKELFAFLLAVGKRTAGKMAREEGSLKRGGGRRLSADQAGPPGAEDSPLAALPGRGLPPDVAVEVAEECRRVLDRLDDEQCQLLLWKAEGWTNQEIGGKLGRAETTVERRLARIRDLFRGEGSG